MDQDEQEQQPRPVRANFSRPNRRPATAESSGQNSEAQSQRTAVAPARPFTRGSASGSRGFTSFDETASSDGPRFEVPAQRYFHSRRVRGEVEKPWTKKSDPKEKWVTILPVLGIVVGLAISAFLIWDGIQSVVKHTYCDVLDEDFSHGLDPSIWEQEVQVGGFG